jgi:hypothetical protein
VRDFQAAMPGRLRSVSTGTKIVYTTFSMAALIGLVVSWQLYGAAVGEEGPAAYYAGAPVLEGSSAQRPQALDGSSAPSPAGGGPVLDLPEEVARPRAITIQIPARKLLEVTHFHLFTIPVYVLVLAHLWLLAKLPVWLHNAGAVLSVVTSGLHIAAPWIVRGSPGSAFLMPVSGIAMLVTLGLMAVVSTVDMWLPQPPINGALAELRRQRAQASPRPPPSP